MNARLCRLVYSMRCAEVDVQKLKSLREIQNACDPANVEEEYRQGCGWCGGDMGWKGLLPKLTPKTFGCAKVPSGGRWI